MVRWAGGLWQQCFSSDLSSSYLSRALMMRIAFLPRSKAFAWFLSWLVMAQNCK